MADWNSDGFDDLLVGEVLVKSGQSKIRLYLGTGSPPVFLDFVYLQADDSDIVVPAQNYWVKKDCGSGTAIRGVTGAISPQVADWNGDGLKDLLVGDGMGYINYFQRLPDGKLTEKPDISANGTIIDVGSISAPVVTDWNNDGLLDLIVGVTELAYSGKEIRVYLNSGTADNPVLTDYEILLCGNDTIKVPHPEPEVADLDLDGLNDLLVCGYYSEVSFYKNVGTAQNPVFLTEELLDLTCTNPFGPNRSICVCDWDHNGAPDILYGVSDGSVYRFMNNAPVKIKVKKPFVEYGIFKNNKLGIFDIKGRLIGSFGKQDNVPNGVYYIKVPTNNGSLIRKIVIMK